MEVYERPLYARGFVKSGRTGRFIAFLATLFMALGLAGGHAKASNVLVGSESTDDGYLWFWTDDIWWASEFEIRHEGESPVSGEATFNCDLSETVSVPITLDSETRVIGTPPGVRECSLDVDVSNDNWDKQAIDLYARLGTPALERSNADRYLDDALSKSLGRPYTYGSHKTISCGVERAKNRRLCDVSFGGGILKFKGKALVAIHRTGIASARHLERIRLRMVNIRCLTRVRGQARRNCVRIVRRQAQAPVVRP